MITAGEMPGVVQRMYMPRLRSHYFSETRRRSSVDVTYFGQGWPTPPPDRAEAAHQGC